MGREVRKVPKDWKHPENRPLRDNFNKNLKEWNESHDKWKSGLRMSYVEYPKLIWVPIEEEDKHLTYAEYAGKRPEKNDYMPEWSEKEKTHYQMYETCSEGTPISPVMETPEELAKWLENNNASAFGNKTANYKSWLSVAKGKDVCSAVIIPGKGLVSGVEAFGNDD